MEEMTTTGIGTFTRGRLSAYGALYLIHIYFLLWGPSSLLGRGLRLSDLFLHGWLKI